MNKELYSHPRTGTCPSCKEVVANVVVEEVAGAPTANTNSIWRTVAYSCPKCTAILGVQMEPEALRAGISAQVKTLLEESEKRIMSEVRRAVSAGQNAFIAVKALEEKLDKKSN